MLISYSSCICFVCHMLCIFTYVVACLFFFFFKQKTAYELRISDWSSDVCSSDLCRLSGDKDVDHHCHGAPQVQLGDPADAAVDTRCGGRDGQEIGRASCRERVCQYV